jgi:membrane associated rhomboid family serine protease
MLIPYNVDVPMERVPVTNWILIGLTILVSLFVLVEEPEATIRLLLLQRGSDFSLTQVAGYVLLHAGLIHLGGNMIFLFCFGNAVNAKLGHATFVIFCLASGIVAGLAWLLLGEGEALLGASGAIMGIVGAFLVLYPRNNVSVFYFFLLRDFTGTFDCPSALVICGYLAFDVGGLVLASASRVAYIAHVVGMLFGILIAVVLLLTRRIESTRYEENLLQILNIQR